MSAAAGRASRLGQGGAPGHARTRLRLTAATPRRASTSAAFAAATSACACWNCSSSCASSCCARCTSLSSSLVCCAARHAQPRAAQPVRGRDGSVGGPPAVVLAAVGGVAGRHVLRLPGRGLARLPAAAQRQLLCASGRAGGRGRQGEVGCKEGSSKPAMPPRLPVHHASITSSYPGTSLLHVENVGPRSHSPPTHTSPTTCTPTRRRTLMLCHHGSPAAAAAHLCAPGPPGCSGWAPPPCGRRSAARGRWWGWRAGAGRRAG